MGVGEDEPERAHRRRARGELRSALVDTSFELLSERGLAGSTYRSRTGRMEGSEPISVR